MSGETVGAVELTEAEMTEIKRYLIERDIAGIGGMSIVELCGAARSSNQAINKVGNGLQWVHSYVAGDKSFCVYLARSEDDIRTHAEASGFPVSRITEIPTVIDPLTANN